MTKLLNTGPEARGNLDDPSQRSQAVIRGLEHVDPRFVLHLPSSTLQEVLNHFLNGPGKTAGRVVFPIPREEEGIAVLTGMALAGQRAVMIMQDNGIGNLLTALLTLAQPYHISLLCIVSRRGGLGEYNSMIHSISERTPDLLSAAGVRFFELDGRTPLAAWDSTIVRAHEFSMATHRPIFVLANLMGG